MLLARGEFDHGEARGKERHSPVFARGVIRPLRARLAPRCSVRRRLAVHAKRPGPPAAIALPARGVLARPAFFFFCGARSARRSLIDDFRTAPSAKPFRSPGGVELSLFSAPRLPAGFADGAGLDGLASAARAQAGLHPLAPALPRPLARHAAAALGVASTIWGSPRSGFGVSGASGLPVPLSAGLAYPAPGGRPAFPALGAQALRAPVGGAFTVALALIRAGFFQVLVWHPVSLPGMYGIRAAGAGPARRLAGGSPPRGKLPHRVSIRAQTRCSPQS